MAELMPIGEFSALCQLSVKKLRHYDDMGLLKPAHVDPITGYRYYHADQTAVAASIGELRRLGMPLGEISAFLDARRPKEVRDLVDRHRQRLAGQLRDAERRLALIEQLVAKEHTMIEDISEVDLPSQRVATRTVEGPPAMFLPLITAAFMDLFATLRRDGVEPTGPPIQVVHYGDENRFEHEACFPIGHDALDTAIRVRELPSEPAAVVRHTGPLEDGNLVVHSVIAWLQGRGHHPVMPFRVTLLAMPPVFTPPEYADASDPVVEVAVPFDAVS